MSVSSINYTNSFPPVQPSLQIEGEPVFRFKDLMYGLLNDFNREDGKSIALGIDKTSKARPVRLIVLGERDIGTSEDTALAIRKIYSLLKNNLGFLINPQERTLDETSIDAFIELIRKCQGLASDLNLLDIGADLQKLTKKIDLFLRLMEEQQDFFLYRYTDENRTLLAFRISSKTPEEIQKSPGFWRRCTKVAYVEFSQMRAENKGTISKELFSKELTRRVFFSLTKVTLEEKGGLFPLQAGLRLKESVWRFICLHSDRVNSECDKTISDVTQHEFLQILDFLLSPTKYPLSWSTINSLWETARKLRIEKVQKDCLLWLKNEITNYAGLPQDEREIVFNQVVSWYQDIKALYPLECEFFFSEVVQSTKRLPEFIQIVNCFIEKGITLTGLKFSSASNLSIAHYKTLAALTTLRDLSLGDIRINDEEMKVLASLKLEELNLEDGSYLTEGGLQHLATMTTLKKASIGRLSPYLSDTGLKFLSRVPLSSIDLTRCDLVTNEGLRSLKGRITELSFGRSAYLTPAVLANLVSLPLEKLTLFRISGLVTQDLLALNSFSNLKSLELVAARRREELETAKVTDLVIPLLAVACPKLTHLKLENVSLTNAGMHLFHSLMSLEELTLSQVSVSLIGSVTRLSKLTSLGLLQCDLITGRSLRPLTEMFSLRSLDLMSKQIGDLSLPDILNITQLTSLNLAGCAFTSPQALKDCLQAATRLKRLAVSTQFFTLAQGIAPGILAHGDIPASADVLENTALDYKQLCQLTLSIKERIPLDYFQLLLKRDAKGWMPKIIEELGKRIGKQHNFDLEDFTKALELISWAVDNNSLELATYLWDLFLEPTLHNYGRLSHSQIRWRDHIDSVDARLVYSIYKQSYGGFFTITPRPCPLQVIQFLAQKKAAKNIPKRFQDFIDTCLFSYKQLFRLPNHEEVEDLWRVNIGLSMRALKEITPSCLAISNFLVRVLYVKLVFPNKDISMYVDDLSKQLRSLYYRKFDFDNDTLREIVDLIIFSRKYELQEIEKIFSISFLKCLAELKDITTDKGFSEILEILKEAKLSLINIDMEELLKYVSREDLEWYSDKFELEGVEILIK